MTMQSPELSLAPELTLRPDDIEAVANQDRRVALSAAATDAITACHATLEKAKRDKRIIYGLTTGFGPLAGHFVDSDDVEALQKNLVYHLASGTGELYRPQWARAMMVTRAACLARGHSAVRVETLRRLLQWINEGLVPAVPRYGSVGASGDLTPLAHMALALIGEGEVIVDGRRSPAGPVLEQQDIAALDLGDRDGLALVNGTSAMTALAALAQMRGRRALARAVELSALFAECMGAHSEAYDELLSTVRPHQGQRRITDALRERLKHSQRLISTGGVQTLFTNSPASTSGLPQDAYSLRCIPQMLGAVADALDYHDATVTTELNSVTDNPVFDSTTDRIVHGGNFFGQHIALVSDHFNQALTTISVLAERQIARITDESMSPYPAFLQPHRPGVHSGLMGAQVTASSLIAELRSTAVPLGIQSIPTNANNQDVNPMGTLAALRSHQILDRSFEVLAILAIACVQAHHLASDDEVDGGDFSPAGRELVADLSTVFAPTKKDRPLYDAISDMAKYLDDGQSLR